MKKQILTKVWQKAITPCEALEEFTNLSRDGTLSKEQEEEILEVLERVGKKSLIVNKAEEEIKWILDLETELCQTK